MPQAKVIHISKCLWALYQGDPEFIFVRFRQLHPRQFLAMIMMQLDCKCSFIKSQLPLQRIGVCLICAVCCCVLKPTAVSFVALCGIRLFCLKGVSALWWHLFLDCFGIFQVSPCLSCLFLPAGMTASGCFPLLSFEPVGGAHAVFLPCAWLRVQHTWSRYLAVCPARQHGWVQLGSAGQGLPGLCAHEHPLFVTGHH